MSEAQRLRDSGNLTAAVEVLRTQLRRQPDDGEAARLLAQTLYWLRDVRGAAQVYDAALARHPQDTTLRLQYGRMLADTKQYGRARQLVAPLRDVADTRAEADTLLGTIAYWQGDFTAAKQWFREALEDNPKQTEARTQLAQILAASAPWIRVSSGLRHDDQPLDRLALNVEAGWFATPLVPVTIRMAPLAFRPLGGRVRRFWSGEALISGYLPQARLETEVAGGVFQRPDGVDQTEWTGRVALGIRMAPSVTLRGRAERTPYLNTVSSISVPVMTTAVSGLLRVDDPRGWLSEAAILAERFPDANQVNTVYAWLLAPIVYRDRVKLQAGYAFGRGNADESRFVLAVPHQPFPPADPRFNFAGRYVPYYTPSHMTSHSVTAAASFYPAARTLLTLNGSFAVRAREDAPAFVLGSDALQRVSIPRSFSPRRAGSSLDLTLGHGVTLGFTGEIGRTAFYTWGSGDVHLTYRFLSTVSERATR